MLSQAKAHESNPGLKYDIRFLDGGLGTSLEELYAVQFDDSTPLWSSHLLIHDPKTLESLQAEFSMAGADILLTATYQASSRGFLESLPEDAAIGNTRALAEFYMRSSVDIARRAHALSGRENGQVALSLGAYGATISPSAEYSGQYDIEHDSQRALYDFHLDRAMVFVDNTEAWSNLDLIAFETLPRQDEVKAVREVMKTLERGEKLGKQLIASGSKPFWISCVFPNEDLLLPDGSSIEELTKSMLSLDLPIPHAIGINCTKLRFLRPIIARFATAVRSSSLARTYLVIYPDGANDLVYNVMSRQWEPPKASDFEASKNNATKSWDEEFCQIVQDIQRDYQDVWSGLIIGGCCKTTPAMIQKLRQRIEIPSQD